MKLRLVAADLLRNAGRADRALALLEPGLALAPDSAGIPDFDRRRVRRSRPPARSLPLLRAAVARAPRSGAAEAQSRAGAAAHGRGRGSAGARCDELRARSSRRSAAHRVSRDRAALVRRSALLAACTTTSGWCAVIGCSRRRDFADIAAFNAAFARELASLHHASHRPLAQSLRGGTQTERNLPADNPLVAAFFSMLDAPIRDYIARLDDERRASRSTAGSARRTASPAPGRCSLQPGGFHVDHVHPQGWLSSAYYVELPEVATDVTAQAGSSSGNRVCRIDACRRSTSWSPRRDCWCCSRRISGTAPCRFNEGGRR